MSATIAAIPIAAATPAAAPVISSSPAGISSPQDLEQLRALVNQATLPTAPAQAAIHPTAVTAAGPSEFQTLGDSILGGIAKFNSGYNDSMDVINKRLEHISETGALNLGTDYGEVLGLQIEVARWSMSVMGVDNAAKAGTNTLKELSRGS